MFIKLSQQITKRMLLIFSVFGGTCKYFVHDRKLKITDLDSTYINSSRKINLRIGKYVGKSDYALIGRAIWAF